MDRPAVLLRERFSPTSADHSLRRHRQRRGWSAHRRERHAHRYPRRATQPLHDAREVKEKGLRDRRGSLFSLPLLSPFPPRIAWNGTNRS